MLVRLIIALVALNCIHESLGFGINPYWKKYITHYIWKTHFVHEALDYAECVFFTKESKFACAGFKDSYFECPGVWNFTGFDESYFDSFLLAKGLDEKVEDAQFFYLYPKLTNTSTYMVSRVGLDGSPIKFGVFHTQQLNSSYGVFISDDCFSQLVRTITEWNKGLVLPIRNWSVRKFKVVKLAEFYIV